MKDKHYSLEKIKVIQPKAVCHRYTAFSECRQTPRFFSRGFLLNNFFSDFEKKSNNL